MNLHFPLLDFGTLSKIVHRRFRYLYGTQEITDNSSHFTKQKVTTVLTSRTACVQFCFLSHEASGWRLGWFEECTF